MIREFLLPGLLALFALGCLVPSASVAQDAATTIDVVTDIAPVGPDLAPLPSPAPAPSPVPAEESGEETGGLVATIASALGRALGEGLYYVLGIAGAWLMGMMGFKEWNAARVQEALRDEKMKPYTEAVLRFVVDWLTKLLNRQPTVSELLAWVKRQFPEVFAWMGRTEAERTEFAQTFLDVPKGALSGATASGSAGPKRTMARRSARLSETASGLKTSAKPTEPPAQT